MIGGLLNITTTSILIHFLNISSAGVSGGETSREQIDIFLPGGGLYVLFIHGFDTDDDIGGAGLVGDTLGPDDPYWDEHEHDELVGDPDAPVIGQLCLPG